MNTTLQAALAELSRITGKRYPALWKALESLEYEAAYDLLRLARDVAEEITRARRQGARQPWRV